MRIKDSTGVALNEMGKGEEERQGGGEGIKMWVGFALSWTIATKRLMPPYPIL